MDDSRKYHGALVLTVFMYFSLVGLIKVYHYGPNFGDSSLTPA